MSWGFILLTRCLSSHQPDTSWHCSLNRANESWQFISNCPAQTFKCPPQSTNELIWLPLGISGRNLLIHIRFGSMSGLIYNNSWNNTLVPSPPLYCGERREHQQYNITRECSGAIQLCCISFCIHPLPSAVFRRALISFSRAVLSFASSEINFSKSILQMYLVNL